MLWSPYGLRSLSTLSPYYHKPNNKTSPAYFFRGPVSIGFNYLALRALHHYRNKGGSHSVLAGEVRLSHKHARTCAEFVVRLQIYAELRARVIDAVLMPWEETGFLFELVCFSFTAYHDLCSRACAQYDDVTGLGMGSPSSSGMSALVVLIMAEKYH